MPRKVKADPSASLVVRREGGERGALPRRHGRERDDATLTGRQKAVLALFFLAFAVMIFGVIPWEDLGIGLPTLCWWFPEMTASFLLFAILIGVVGRMGEGDFTSTFVDGARDLLGVALIIGIARGITVIMNNGLITDTVLNCGGGRVADLGGVAFINLMYALFLPLSFLIPSSSGLATVAMPIMAPLASFADVPAQLVVTAYQTGQRPGQPGHADLGRRDGRPGHRPGRLRHVAQVRVARAGAAGRPRRVLVLLRRASCVPVTSRPPHLHSEE